MAKPISISNSKQIFSKIQSVLDKSALSYKNVLLRGESGVGKTHMIMDIAKKHDMKLKYFSASTLDPFADLVGIPSPNSDRTNIQYLRSSDINEAEFMFFDELNRAHKRVTNAVFEIIQFGTINGEKLGNLKMVWAAVNPWDTEGYHTEELDIALLGRFHFKIDIPYNVSFNYFENKYNKKIAQIAYDWWQELSDNAKASFSPRLLDYAIDAIINDEPYEYVTPFDTTLINLKDLNKKIQLATISIDVELLKKDIDNYIQILNSHEMSSDEYVNISKTLINIESPKEIASLINLVLTLSPEYFMKIVQRNNSFSYKELRNELMEQYSVKEFIEYEKKIQDKIWGDN